MKGYGAGVELPDYRKIAAPLLLDGFTAGGIVTGQQVPPTFIPDEVRDRVFNPVDFPQGISDIVGLQKTATSEGHPAVDERIRHGEKVIRAGSQPPKNVSRMSQRSPVY